MKRIPILFLILLLFVCFPGCLVQKETPNESQDETSTQINSTSSTNQIQSTKNNLKLSGITTTTTPAKTTVKPSTDHTETNDEDLNKKENLNLENQKNEDFVRISDFVPNAKIDLRYATENNFTNKKIYDFTEPYLRVGTVKKLIKVSKELESHGFGLIIWDGYRPLYAQKKLWEICPNPKYVSNPKNGTSPHCRGNTVDISLYDLETGKEVPVPTEFDDFSTKADRNYSDCSKDAQVNARLLEKIMKKNGFSAYFAEWWHYSDTTSYSANSGFNPANQNEHSSSKSQHS